MMSETKPRVDFNAPMEVQSISGWLLKKGTVGGTNVYVAMQGM